MRKKKLSVYAIGVFGVALTVGMILLTLLIATGSFRLRKTKIVIQTGSAQKEYSGTPLTNSKWKQISGTLAPEHELSVKVKGEQTEIGICENQAEVRVLDTSGMDVSDQYDIEIRPGKLEVFRKKIIFLSYNADKVYDGTPLKEESVIVQNGWLSEGDSWEAYDFADPVSPGVYNNSYRIRILNKDNVDVTKEYDVECEYGSLTIYYGKLIVETGSASKEYDGTPCVNEEYSLREGRLESGHRIHAACTGSITRAGDRNKTIILYIDDAQGNDVTSMYDISYMLGELIVTPVTLYVQTMDVRRPYSGTVYENDWALIGGELVAGDTLEVTTTQQMQPGMYDYNRPGTYENSLWSFSVRDSQGRDVTDSYRVAYECGVLILTE